MLVLLKPGQCSCAILLLVANTYALCEIGVALCGGVVPRVNCISHSVWIAIGWFSNSAISQVGLFIVVLGRGRLQFLIVPCVHVSTSDLLNCIKFSLIPNFACPMYCAVFLIMVCALLPCCVGCVGTA